VEIAARLAVVAAMIWILRQRPSFATRAGAGPAAEVAAGVLAGLIIVAVCTVQLRTAALVWQWANPGQVLPVHPVLQAAQSRVWSTWGIVQLLVLTVVAAPLSEELFFRGLVLQAAWRYTGHAWNSILLSAVLFGLIHGSRPQDILPLCTMGLALGYLRLRTRSLTACVMAHGLFNARTMVITLFCPEVANQS
jgi:membrane protease YdiL (CAAX protease family)